MADDGAEEGIISIAQCFILAKHNILHGYFLILKVFYILLLGVTRTHIRK